MSFDVAVNDFPGLGIHGESARGEDEAIGDDGLVHEIGRCGWGLLGGDRGSRHVAIDIEGLVYGQVMLGC